MPWIAMGLIGAAAFLAATAYHLPWLALATKGVPVVALLLWLRHAHATRYRLWISVGLAFSLLGDWLLAWPQDLFVFGLSAFFVAHLAYVRAYCTDCRQLAWPYLLLSSAFGVCMYSVLAHGGLGDLALPVAAYAAVISVMLWRALARLGSRETHQRSARLAAAGALLFVTSDSLIGIDRFVSMFTAAPYAIIVSYWLGQWAIAASTFSHKSRSLQSP